MSKRNIILESYFLGWMFSDGNIHYSEKAQSFSSKLKVQERDKEVLFLFDTITKWRKGTETREGHHSVFIRTYNREFAKTLIRAGVLPDKSGVNKNTLMFPKFKNKYLYQYFIRGLFEGDGSYTLVNDRLNVTLTMINYHFMVDLKQFLYTEYSVQSDLVKRDRDTGYLYYLRIRNTANCKRFVDAIYKDNLNLVLNRKYSIIKSADYSPTLKMKSQNSTVKVATLDGKVIGTWKSCYEIEYLSLENKNFILNTLSKKGKVPYLVQSNVAASCRSGKPYKGLLYSYI